jgi:ParB family transcriptional regulator, chromosome partitioning protein
LNHPQIALRFVLSHMIAGSNLWIMKPDPLKAAKPEIGASIAANPAILAFEERHRELLTLCGFEEDRTELVRPSGNDYSLAQLFARLLKLPEDDIL